VRDRVADERQALEDDVDADQRGQRPDQRRRRQGALHEPERERLEHQVDHQRAARS
jgi:hypothetical protein